MIWYSFKSKSRSAAKGKTQRGMYCHYCHGSTFCQDKKVVRTPIFSRGHVTLHLAVSVVRPSVRLSHFWIAIGLRITAPAQSSATGLPFIRPCFEEKEEKNAWKQFSWMPKLSPAFILFHCSFTQTINKEDFWKKVDRNMKEKYSNQVIEKYSTFFLNKTKENSYILISNTFCIWKALLKF